MLLPAKAAFLPDEPIEVELPPEPSHRRLGVAHLGRAVATLAVPPGTATVTVPPLPEGGYDLELGGAPGRPTVLRGAVDVLADPLSRLRYGFVASFQPGRDPGPVTRLFRRLHLTGAQFYDWAYRHAQLVGPEEYHDPLGRPVSMPTVRALSSALRAAGTAPIGYAAVYAVGNAEWQRWQHAALTAPDGSTYGLRDFLRVVDPADPGWMEHLTSDLRRAVASAGFCGFHLDQYGWPRRAVRPDGRVVDVAAAFVELIDAVHHAVPGATLIFNNVNDFPVWASAAAAQHVTYSEVWEPHSTLGDLADVATRARTLAPHRPVVVAAYQTVYATAPTAAAETANRLTMATLFSHGATQLLAGEAGSVLVDPYYVNHQAVAPTTLDMLARWYDLLVAAGDVLVSPGLIDITRSVVGQHNDEIDVHSADPMIVVGHEPVPGTVWRRVVDTPHGQIVHLINLCGQGDSGWDTSKVAPVSVRGLRLRVRRVGGALPTVRVADPDQGPHFTTVAVDADGNHARALLPDLNLWQLVLISDA